MIYTLPLYIHTTIHTFFVVVELSEYIVYPVIVYRVPHTGEDGGELVAIDRTAVICIV